MKESRAAGSRGRLLLLASVGLSLLALMAIVMQGAPVLEEEIGMDSLGVVQKVSGLRRSRVQGLVERHAQPLPAHQRHQYHRFGLLASAQPRRQAQLPDHAIPEPSRELSHGPQHVALPRQCRRSSPEPLDYDVHSGVDSFGLPLPPHPSTGPPVYDENCLRRYYDRVYAAGYRSAHAHKEPIAEPVSDDSQRVRIIMTSLALCGLLCALVYFAATGKKEEAPAEHHSEAVC
eukprot:CAMPEP_0114560264 /NCGR_PEP_ID=MMETSP0114-20121206/11368_1 /TAXON_ID=31324 /ORGANISM="Goniomonas sp, Strain m" /LENGTH=231 /DNA_ID=CAMNT_0001745801 /DNA_START=23 /DNA_END=718 /DNA_ORIENTATION=-